MINSKIKNMEQLKKIITRLKSQGQKIILTNGCFDILHYGHVKYLEEAKNTGDILIVAVNSDDSVRRMKGKCRPIISQNSRASILAGLESVDFVTIFSQPTPLGLIKILKPDILVKGGDWKEKDIVGSDVVKEYKGKIITIPYIKNYSTSKIIKRIANRFR